MRLADVQFKKSPPHAPLATYQVAMKYEDGAEQHSQSWMVEIDDERFEVSYTTTVEVLNSHKRKNKRLITVRQDGYLRKL